MTAILAALALRAVELPVSSVDEVYYVVHISPLGYTAAGLCLVTLLYWRVEYFCSTADLRVYAILAQAIALPFAAAMAGGGIVTL